MKNGPMGKKSLVGFLFLLTSIAYCQEKADTSKPPPPKYGWKHSLVSGLTLTQVSYTNWAQGGENSLAYTFTADGKSVDDEEGTNSSNSYKFAFGQARLGSQGLRKTDDRIELESVLLWKLGVVINPYVGGTLKTQFAKGYKYDDAGNRTEVSQFFDPAYLTQSAGFSYQLLKEVKTRLGLGLREVITNKFNQYADDPKTTEIEKTSVDGGLESVTNLDWPIDENLLLTSQLEIFTPFKKFGDPVIRNLTTFTAKVSKYVTAIFSVQMIKEPQVSPRTQVKETISLGLSYTIF